MSSIRLPNGNVVVPIWTPQDAIDTAQAFHAEIDNAERGTTVDKPRWTQKLFGKSRFRRAAIYDGLAVTLLVALMACLGVVAFAASAHADPDGASVAFAAEYGPAVCQTLDDHDSIPGMLGVGLAIVDEGLSEEQAGEVIALSVREICPRHLDLLKAFIAYYSGNATGVA